MKKKIKFSLVFVSHIIFILFAVFAITSPHKESGRLVIYPSQFSISGNNDLYALLSTVQSINS